MNRRLPLAHSSYRLSPSEELVNSITHGIGLILSVIGAMVMIAAVEREDVWRAAGCSVYLASLITVYAMSTILHSCQTPRWKSFFRALDQGSIYLLVAATYTPFSLAYLRTERLVDPLGRDLGRRPIWISGEGAIRLSCRSSVDMAVCVHRRDTIYFNTNIAWCDIHWCTVVDARRRGLLCDGSRLLYQRRTSPSFPRSLACLCDGRKHVPFYGNLYVRRMCSIAFKR